MFNEPVYKSLRGRLAIDSLRLDQELMEHPSILQSVCETAADATQIRDAAKNDYDIALANAASRLRNDAGPGGKPYGQTTIDSMLPAQPEVQKAVAALDDAKRDMAYWQALADSMREKGSALRRIAELTVSGYLTPNSAYEKRKEDLSAQRTWRPR